MAQNPLRLAIRDADRVERELRVMFGRYLGSREHPRGRILSIYRQARLAMDSVYRNDGPMAMVRGLEVLEEQRQALVDVATIAVPHAVGLGRESAKAQLAGYTEAGIDAAPAMEQADARQYVNAWQGPMEAQLARVGALVQTGADPELILGDGPSLHSDRKGALQPAPIAAELGFWLAMAASAGYLAWILGRGGRSEQQIPFEKQAIAAIDERTTNCCLRVHGQIVGLRDKFVLRGTPRFADRLAWSPFHWYCRTSVALYLERYDEGFTGQMRQAARTELADREAGREEIHPASATSTRGLGARGASGGSRHGGSGVFERVRRKAGEARRAEDQH